MNRKILFSLAMVVFAAAVVIGATGAFFSDTETSSGNTFTAGAIDLKIDNTSYITSTTTGLLVASPTTTWGLSDLTNQLFFNFTDLKPGDQGEDTISLHVDNNDSYACMDITLTGTPENSQTEPEIGDGDTTADQGELQNELNFAFWADDGDNVYETGETIFKKGTAASLFAADNAKWALADSLTNVWTGVAAPLPGNSVRYIAKYWCFGTLTETPITQDNASSTNPLTRPGTGFTCSGSSSDNKTQTDGMTANVSFEAVQSRNNSAFVCGASTPGGETRQKVGALLSAYSAPSCDVTVQPGQSIQTALDAASAGQTVCVASGTHTTDTYPLRVSKDNLTLASVSGSASTTLGGGVILDNDGTKVTGLTINDSTLLGATFGVYINTGVSGAVVSYNEIVGDDVASTQGIVNALGTTAGALIAHNKIHDWHQGVFMNDSSSMTIEYNTITSNAVGSANDHPVGNIIRYNHVSGNTAEGVGILLSGADSIVVNQNNLSGNTGDEELNSYGTNVVNAENNWWGDGDPSDDTSTLALVDFTPFEVSAFPLN